LLHFYDPDWCSRSVVAFGKASISPEMKAEYPDYKEQFQEAERGFELDSFLLQMIDVKEIVRLADKGWVPMPKKPRDSVRSTSEIYQDFVIESAMTLVPTNSPPCLLVRTFTGTTYAAVTNFPFATFSEDPRMENKMSHLLFACKTPMRFGAGSVTNEAQRSLAEVPRQSPSKYAVTYLYDNNDRMCVLGTIINLCKYILEESAMKRVLDVYATVINDTSKTPANLMSILFQQTEIGFIRKPYKFHYNTPFQHAYYDAPNKWVCVMAEFGFTFAVVLSGLQNKHGHCVGIFSNQIVDCTLEKTIPLTEENLNWVLGEKVHRILNCWVIAPLSRVVKKHLRHMTYEHYELDPIILG